MPQSNSSPSPDEVAALQRLAADLTYGTLREEEAVALAAKLLADGVGGSATTDLAAQPAELADLHLEEIGPLVRQMLDELGIDLPSIDRAGWSEARRLAESIMRGSVEPPDGALMLWRLWNTIGRPGDPLVEMLVLHERWEVSQGNDRHAVELQIVEEAATVAWYADQVLRAP